jgi:uncharacterized repeat protein (TIGR03803 family)
VEITRLRVIKIGLRGWRLMLANIVFKRMGPMTKKRYQLSSNFLKLHRTGAYTVVIALVLGFLGVRPAHGQTGMSAKETTLYTFSGGTDGGSPYASLIRDANGNLYGATFAGGAKNLGTIFKIDKAKKETVLYSFTGSPDGEHSSSNLLRDKAGNMYGVAYEGGASGFGAVFKLDKTGTESVLYSFGSGTDGEYPGSGLIEDAAGNLYGTTGYGGASGNGTVYKISKSGAETILYNFSGADGQYPFGNLLRDSSGNLYGTTSYGGTSGNGTVFKLTRKGKETVLHSFAGGTDGANPYAGLVRDKKGNFYGTTYNGGAGCKGYDCGTVFKLTPNGKETVLHAFALSDGHYPDFGTLVRDSAGNLYGTTYAGGTADMGVVFKVSSGGKESIVYTFTGGTDEGFPVAGLIQDKAGNLYGTTLGNPTATYGTVFRIKP